MEAMRRESEEQHQLVHDRMERRLLVELNNVSVRVRIQAGLRKVECEANATPSIQDELDEEQEKLLELKAVEEVRQRVGWQPLPPGIAA